MKRRQPQSLREALGGGLRRGLRVCAFLGAGFILTHWLTAGTDEITHPDVMEGRAPAAQAPSTVLDQHRDDCWTGEAPADVDMPGHVIWQHPDGRTVYSARLVGPALDTLFGEGNLPGQPIAFCR